MEPDRYQQHHLAYISGVICLFVSIGLFAFSLYLLPYLFFSWQYSVPAIVTNFSAILQDKYAVSTSGLAWVICFVLDFPALILFVIADVLSNRIDTQIYRNQGSELIHVRAVQPVIKDATEVDSKRLVVKIVLLIIIIFIIAQFFHWVISTNG